MKELIEKAYKRGLAAGVASYHRSANEDFEDSCWRAARHDLLCSLENQPSIDGVTTNTTKDGLVQLARLPAPTGDATSVGLQAAVHPANLQKVREILKDIRAHTVHPFTKEQWSNYNHELAEKALALLDNKPDTGEGE